MTQFFSQNEIKTFEHIHDDKNEIFAQWNGVVLNLESWKLFGKGEEVLEKGQYNDQYTLTERNHQP